MKTKSVLLILWSVLCLFTMTGRATVLLQDNFSYADNASLTNIAGSTLGYMFWTNHSGVDNLAVTSGRAVISGSLAGDDSAYLTNWPYGVGGGIGTNAAGQRVDALYASFTINLSSLPTSAGAYFAHFKDAGSGSAFRCRVYADTAGAAGGFYRVGIANNSGTLLNITNDLSTGTTYTLVMRYVLSSGVSTLWLNPISETNSDPTLSATGTDTPTTANAMATFAMRQNSGEGIVALDNLIVGTTFADVVPGSVNPPSILTQPNDTNNFVGNGVVFKALAGGDQPVSYRWYYNTNTLLTDTASIIGSTSNTLTLNNLTVGQSGTYSCSVTNASGTNVTRFAALIVNTVPIPPVITNQPASVTNVVGDTTTFTVVAGGSTPLTYQWQVVTNNTTNIISGATTPTLTINNVFQGLSGNQYFVTITNQFGATNSAKASLTVVPPPTLSIAQFRAKVDGSFAPTNTTAIYTLQGIVTTWADMTGVANTEFYMQDASGGIVVFWSGANGVTNLPPAGALVRVTGPMAAFNGLLEIEPVLTNALHSVVVLSTNNPLPKAQPLPFDPNVSGYPAPAKNATMDKLEGMYLVASNVTLNLSAPAFVSGANDIITNNAGHVLSATNSVATINFTNQAGQQFILFVNAQSGLPGKAKYTGPVTIYGVLGYFTSAGYEFTPSRFEDIIPYTFVTNVTTNVKRYGDLLTNAYTENVLRPGETLTASFSVGDPEGGVVTLSPDNTGLPGGAFWDGVTTGSTAHAVFHYTAANGDAGNFYTIKLGATSTAGLAQTNTFTVYVPTADEQKVAITEFLANPTTNSAAPNFNPLHRSSGTAGANTNDVYIELANQSGNSIDTSSGFNGWEIDQGSTQILVFDAFGSPPIISSSNAIVVYGGGSPAASLPVNSYASPSGRLVLPITGSGTIILRNGNGYIVDRVPYSASDLNTNGSLTRFPTIDSPFLPQAYVSTNLTTAGLQYDGSTWDQPYKVPAGIANIGVTYVNGQAILNFTANTGLASTLWGADVVNGPYKVIFGRQFPSTSGSFTNASSAPFKFYYISNQ